MKVLGLSLRSVLDSVVLRCCAAALLSLLVSSAPAKCQGEQAGNQLVIHLYVDPIYGDDGAVNTWFNPDGIVPNGPGPECAGANIVGPHSVVDGSGASLFHAPYPFKTVTAAIARINQLSPAPGVPPLPHTDPGTQKVWSYCVIHMLPGWYGRAPASGVRNESLETRTGTHKANRLAPNGEVFPLHIPPRVSLVGASALNTLVDLGQVGTAIEFGVFDSNQVGLTGEGVLIDKITFFACGGLTNDSLTVAPQPNPKECAAILIDEFVPARPTISNCFFQKNAIGILVSAGVGLNPDPRLGPVPIAVEHHGVTVMNCTFAWNILGLWNGQLGNITNSKGISRLNLVNNIFDGSEQQFPTLPCNNQSAALVSEAWPSAYWPNSAGPGGGGGGPGFGSTLTTTGILSAFEGLAQEDMRVVGPSGPVDTNAYEAGPLPFAVVLERHYNTEARMPQGNGIARSMPATRNRVGSPPLTFDPDPSRNIARFTGWPVFTRQAGQTVGPRGVLFVADLICHGSTPGGSFSTAGFPPSGGFDLSMHDLRLSPFAEEARTGTARPPALPNPLVDSGFSGPFPIVMENGNTIYGPPGSMFASSVVGPTVWPHHAWESDAEGFGNPRIHDHPSHVGTPIPGSERIDVGADELGDLVVAGYRFGTTTFLSMSGNHPDNRDSQGLPMRALTNDRAYYLGTPTASAFALPPITVDQPGFRAIDHNLVFNLGNYDYPQPYIRIGPSSVPPSVTFSRTWNSAEYGHPPSGSFSRPGYSHRHQILGGRIPLLPVVPMSIVPTGNLAADLMLAFAEVGKGYRATPADVTPTLLPDIHPWWTDLPPIVLWSFQGYGMSPNFPVWQDPASCLTGNYFFNSTQVGLHNDLLYELPQAFDINAPGSRAGGSAPSGNFSWLDFTPSLDGTPTTIVQFECWAQSPLLMTDFDSYGCGGTLGVRSVGLPSTRVTNPVNPSDSETTTLGFTVEWSDTQVPWQLPGGYLRRSNSQSFKVLVD